MLLTASFRHVPVLSKEVLAFLAPRRGGVYLDGTVGGGGHAGLLLESVEGDARLVGIDRDPEALNAAAARLERFGDRVTLVRDNFRRLGEVLDGLGIEAVDGVLLDLGVSSQQLDSPDRGFSYRGEKLDMRMGPDAEKTAAELLAELSEAELERILREYGEERWAGRIARFIVERRVRKPIVDAQDPVDVIKAAVPAAARRSGPHPARRTFQALRIAVNRELESLEAALASAVDRLKAGGRLVVISFHSLEDRIVKNVMRREERGCTCPPGLPVCACNKVSRLKVLTRKPVVASSEERAQNPRSRSAKLRAAERVFVERES